MNMANRLRNCFTHHNGANQPSLGFPWLMKKVVIVCLLAAALSMAQRQSVVVLPSIADQDAKLSPRQLDLLTDKVRSIIPNILPLKDFNLLKQGVVEERLGEEGLYLACKEGSCVGDLVAQVQADFGARCEVLSVNSQLYLKFELYGTLKGERDAGTIDQFNDLVKDFAAMLALLEKKVPVAFKKIIAEPAAPAAPPPVQYVAPTAGGSYIAEIVSEPAGAVLSVNGMPLRNCPKAPCRAEFYENRLKISASLEEHESKDTAIIITQPNQLVNLKLKPITYAVTFAGEPLGASLVLEWGKSSYKCQVPCNTLLKKGDVKVKASKELYESLDTTVLITGNNQLVSLKLNPNFGTLEIKGAGAGWQLAVGDKHIPLGNIRILPGAYDAKLFHGDYEDIDFKVEVEKGEHKAFDISDKKVNRFGILDIKPAYLDGIGESEDWRLTAGGESAAVGEVGEIKLLPGGHEIMLTHNCYEDIKLNAKIERGMKTDFYMHDWLVLKQSSLVLKAKRKGRNISKQALVNGKQVETPYEGYVPLCSDIEIHEKEMADNVWKKIDVELKHNEQVEYIYRDGTVGSHILGAVLDVAGVVFFVLSYNSFSDRDKAYDAYADNKKTGPDAHSGDWKKMENYHSKGNAFLITGSALLALGIGVHIWF